ncbi:MAG: hypothetical protein MUQ48_02315, partial [Pirellulales bacterium]|nr:hypothetical protein [Pirellulales bacterium]
AYRSLPRPSKPPNAKTSPMCPLELDHPNRMLAEVLKILSYFKRFAMHKIQISLLYRLSHILASKRASTI